MEKLFIRVDMNQTIATGHVMRCLAIADELKVKGIESVFISADFGTKQYVENRSYECIVLNSDWTDLNAEIDVMLDIIEHRNITHLLIDSYQVTDLYLRTLYDVTYTIYIDDLNEFIYPVHAILCYVSYWKRFKHYECYQKACEQGKIEVMPKLYLGCQYAPLRAEFRDLPPKNINFDIKEILLMSGGTDNYHVLKKILEEIDIEKYQTINVICGKYNKDYGVLCSRWKDSKVVNLYQAVENIVDFMKSADVAISAGGTTLYELCAVGTPTICYSIADNQLDNVNQFVEDDIMQYVGDYREGPTENINQLINNLDYNKRKLVSEKMHQMMKG